MLEILFIILIFLEIALTYFICIKLTEFDKKIQDLNTVVIEKREIINEVSLKIRETIHKINVVTNILANEKIWRVKKAVSFIISTIEFFIILKTFNFKKGVKFNLKNAKKLLFTGLSRRIIIKIINSFAVACG